MRDKTLPYAKRLIVGTQYGSGLNEGSIEVGALHVKAMADYCHKANLSCAFLFVDLAAAFASIVRRIVVNSVATDMELARRLHACEFSSDDVCDILDDLRTLKSLDEAKTPGQLRKLLREMLGSTWVVFEHLNGFLAYGSGTAAGTSLADVIFTIAFFLHH